MSVILARVAILYPVTARENDDVRNDKAYTVAARPSRAWEWDPNQAFPWWSKAAGPS